MKKIKKEQLKLIKDQQQRVNELITQIGILESQKHSVLHELAKTNADIEDVKIELEKEYGQVSINLDDGSYSEIESKEKLEVVESE